MKTVVVSLVLVATSCAEAEKHLRNIHQLTFGGENAEAYFSGDGKKLCFQSTRDSLGCDQIFTINVDGSDLRMVSSGKGRTTCSFFSPDGSRIVYASTHLGGEACPEPPPRGPAYVWAIYGTFDIFSCAVDGSDLKRLTDAPGYDAEATFSPDGSKIVFTSSRDGDLEIYTMNPDGSDQRRLTHELGYDGGPFFSPDGTRICFRASRPADEEARTKYKGLIDRGLVEPSRLELYVMDADGSDIRQVTADSSANFCPFFHPSGKKLIYASNKNAPDGRNFDLFLIDIETKEEEQITFQPTFDGFPMFSPDGRQLVWASNRFGKQRGETNIFIADWVE